MKNFFTLVAVIITFHSPFLTADVSAKIIAYNCYSCHGEQLTILYPSEKISKVQLTKILLDFKYDRKEVTIMNRISKGYSDNELESVATFLTTMEN
ncbi:MAG: hypothetical protein L3J59_08845 [Methylococcaceae bacterium]|nr:hypothetical protein [Methylococcaceae bacterium]